MTHQHISAKQYSFTEASLELFTPCLRTSWWRLAKEMLDGQHQRVDIPAHARTAHKDLSRKDWKRIFTEWSLISPPPPHNPSVKGLN